jgi:serine/threonine-protein kinase
MEYIRGEDLRALLLRIGRLPPDKAAEIAVQLASALAAAHERGVLHRDLKPANVLIDERGQAHIVDFGLAAAVGTIETKDIRSGTPAYMAPEQRAGEAVTERSDLYSLGLVLYEVFTGKRAFGTAGEDDPTLSQDQPRLIPPSSVVDGLAPSVERVILRCLQKDPQERPLSALAVQRAFPGGDLLAAAMARGETPAPALVAEAGEFRGLRPGVAWACLVAVLASLAGTLLLAGRSRLSQIVPLPRSPELLVSDARSILEGLGYPTRQRDSTYGFSRQTGYIEHLMAGARSPTWWRLLARGEPSVIRFWYRESPEYLVPYRVTEFFPAEHDPPPTVPGMVSLELDTRGRLRGLEAVPVPRDAGDEPRETDWKGLFTAAQFDFGAFSPIPPRWLAYGFGDRRAAWEGRYPDAPEIPIRIEAASVRGQPVAFRIIEPWTEPIGGAGKWVRPSDAAAHPLARLAHLGLHLVLMLALGLLARHNLRLGRGDRKVAFRLAWLFFALVMLQWTLAAHHIPEASQLQIFFGGLYRAFFASGLAWLFYLALEPYARKLWPRTMISWVRLLSGRFRDPLVGRDVLMGCLYGTGLALTFHISRLAPVWTGRVPSRPDLPLHPAELLALRGVRESVAELLAVQVNIFTLILFLFGGLLLLRFVLRRDWLAIAVHGTLYIFVFASGFGLLTITLAIGFWYPLFFRCGWVSIAVGTLTADLLLGYPLTTDLRAWHAHASVLVALVCLALTLYGFKVALGGRPAFKDLLADA